MYIKTLSVSMLNNYIKKIMDSDFILNNAYIKGEISNFKLHTSGHIYFSLKDEYSKINCVMFKDDVKFLTFIPEDGMKVIVNGRVSVYQKEGAYELYCKDIKLEGMGELYVAFQKLKEKLEGEGLFDEKHKKPLPEFPQKIGVVTSPTGAAVRDIINVIMRRNRFVHIIIYPSLVQGIGASENVISGIEYFNKMEDIDLIIVARGGGSMEELWAFNDEKLARAVYNSKKPIISGVGHEIDFTIIDFVSDMRAPTPSAAAEIAVPDIFKLKEKVSGFKTTLDYHIQSRIKSEFNTLDILFKSIMIKSPENYIANQYNLIDKYKEMLYRNLSSRLSEKREKLGKIHAKLESINPSQVLKKGYAVIQDDSGNILSTVKKLKSTQSIQITLKDGKVHSKITCID